MSNPKIPSRADVKIAIGLIENAIRDCDEQAAGLKDHPEGEHYKSRRCGLDSAYFFLTGERIPEPEKAEGA